MTTVHLGRWETNAARAWSKREVRRLLGIKQRRTINEHLMQLGYAEPLSDAEVKEIFALKRFMAAGRGSYYSHESYLRLRSVGLLAQKFLELGIDIDKEFEELINANNTEEIVSGNRSRISGSNPRSQGVCCP